MSVLLFFIVLYVLNTITLQKVFAKAGEDGKKALVPGVAAGVWSRMIGKSQASTWWLLFPIVNFFTYSGMCIDLVRSFGMHGFWDSVLAVVASPLQFWRIGNNDQYKYEGPILTAEGEWKTKFMDAQKRNDKIGIERLSQDARFAKTPMRDWTEAIIFAVFAAAFIRMFLIEAYVIPTPSMEGSLKVGDYLFVSKAHYGIRTPQTVVQFPLIFNHFSSTDGSPFNKESYLESPSLKPMRLPALESIDRNEPVVFNYPEGDSVYLYPGRTFSIYDLRNMGPEAAQVMRKYPLVTRPLDKMDHYIKRCVAIGGDSVAVRDGQVFINGAAVENPKKLQLIHTIASTSTPINIKKLEELGVDLNSGDRKQNMYALDNDQIAAIKAWGADVTVTKYTMQPNGNMFPRKESISATWSGDNYGPIWVPKQGATTPLSMANIALYKRVIDVYEGNDLEIRDNKIFINGQEATSYTFKHNYYWMMGDNRHNSEDSRFWGYVPSTHVVGKPLFIWFSTKEANIKKGINWDRMFTSAQKF